MGPGGEASTTAHVANRLWCVVLRGFSSSYAILVGYFIARCLKNTELFCMTIVVLKAVEGVGFLVTKVVTDIFKRLSEDGTLVHAVPHTL